MTTQQKEKDDHGRSQAASQLKSIQEMVEALDDAGENDTKREAAEQAIQEDALEVAIRSDWYAPGLEQGDVRDVRAAEYKILLCTGGPAVRITGALDQYGQPESAVLEYQDWGTPWTAYYPSDEKALLAYAQQFYFGS